MISYSVYKIVHLLGVFMALMSIAGLATHVINGGGKSHPWRKPLAIFHGIGLLLALVGGFGLLARINQFSFPGWVVGKLLIWLAFGALLPLLIKRGSFGKPAWFLTLALSVLAVYLANYKPF